MKLPTFFQSVFLCACCLLAEVSAAQQQTILVFGDSLSAAYGIPRASGWVNLLQQELQRSHPQYQVVNASISGETASGGRRRIAQALRQHSPSIVILELGANDGLRGAPIADIETNLSAIIQQSRKANRQLLLVGMQLPPNYGKNYTDQFKALYSRLAQRHHVELVPFMLANVLPEQFQADNLHPTALAQAQILQPILAKLKPLLKANKF
ncbi:MAG: arylesterase [Candidatus Nitrotoga sp.]